MGKKTQHCLLLLLCLSELVHYSAALTVRPAVVEISYAKNNNETVDKYCECGVYGRNSPLEKALGIVTLPSEDPKGCGSDPVYNRNSSSPPWIALVKRGNCTFSEKINAAKRQGAAGVVVYNVDGSGNSTTHMAHSDAAGIVAIMIGNAQGTEIVKLVKNGTDVKMIIEVRSYLDDPMFQSNVLYLAFILIIVTGASIPYFAIISVNRLYGLSMHRRSERRLKSEAKKAIGRLQVRILKTGDEETTSETHVCAMCIGFYKAGEVVTVLTCDHIFHKPCIEPWLLERRTCPMCNCDILKAMGVEEESIESLSDESPPEVTVITVTGAEPIYEVPLTDPASPDPERQQHRYDNSAFEGDAEAGRR
ncbi:RING finger protein 148-like [Sebastes umbrosus]|uniref:RING finger protein 148-like n=1 Tax=Sebastes umbrosus TaxID=72105 RepID=UPI00189F9932|nr:RING finger protein 148-like [Sebastes umbrosus]